MKNKIDYGEEKLYCPICKRVMRRIIPNLKSQRNFYCQKCKADWLIVDMIGKYVLSPMSIGREPITKFEKKKVNRK